MSANGRVKTGFCKPYVALYAHSGTTVTYTSGQILARGVSVSLEPEYGDNNDFYADNQIAESIGGSFTGGKVTLTVDGLNDAAQKLILGLPTATTTTVGTASVDVYHYGDAMEVPYVGIGYITRYMSDGVASYVPTVVRKARFTVPKEEAQTQEDAIEFKTQELEANIFRDDTADHDWKYIGAGQATETEAENVVKVLLGLSV